MKSTYYGIHSVNVGWLRYELRDHRAARRFYAKHRRRGDLIAVGRRVKEYPETIGWTLNYDNVLHTFGNCAAPSWVIALDSGGNF